MGLSHFAEEQIIKHTLGISSFSSVSTTYVALLSDLSADGQSYTEVSGGSYARVEMNAADYTSISDGSMSNDGDIVWPTATDDWGNVRFAAIFNDVSAGDMLWWGELDISKSVAFSSIFKILDGMMTVSTGGAFSAQLRDDVIAHIFKGVSAINPASVYAGVGVATNNNASIDEPPGSSGYSRIEVTEFTQTANGQYAITSPDPISFVANGGDWGDVMHVGLWDDDTNGNLLYALELDDSRELFDGDGIEFASDDIVVKVD